MANELITSTVNAPLPAHLQQYQGPTIGTELLGRYIIPPRLKIIQPIKMTDAYKDYAEGTCLMVPNLQMVSNVLVDDRTKKITGGDRYFYFTPIFFYPEFCIWNSLDTKGELPMIRERTSDPRHPIAIRARSMNREDKQPERPDGKPMQYVEHLNFIVMLYHDNQEINMKPVLMTFVRGEHRTGRKLAEWIKARKAPAIYAGVYQAIVEKHKNQKGQEWWGFNIDNPAEGSPWVDSSELYTHFESAHKDLADTHAQGLLQADYDDGDLAATGTVDATSVKNAQY